MQEVQLVHSDKVALVDDCDYALVIQHRWRFDSPCYAMARIDGQHTLMHRLILGLSYGDGKQVDHVNCNGLDNRRDNLRLCNHRQNQGNAKLRKDNTSGYKGVCWVTNMGKWRAQIRHSDGQKMLGYFDDVKEAARVYDAAAREQFGEFARTNF